MTPKRERFIQEYIRDPNATQAAFKAGYSQDTAHQIGYYLLRNVDVQAAISSARDEMAEKAGFGALDVLKRWVAIATADPNELIDHRTAPCRYCYGAGHHFQWKHAREYNEAVEDAERKEKPLPSDVGGYGYSVRSPPNPECPDCSGEGVGYTVAADTRTLSPQARMLYAGVKQTKDGLEIKMHDQGKALENVARHLGMFQDKLEVVGKLTLEQLVLQASVLIEKKD